MKWTSHHAILSTLLYAQLFDYPLLEQDVWLWCVGPTTLSQHQIQKLLSHYPQYKNYYGLELIKQRVPLREKRLKFSNRKKILVSSVLKILKLIPSIQLIGISGGLAMNNADENDDIDFFFIVRPHTIWISRIIVLVVLEILGKRRKFNISYEKDLICANMFVSSANLTIPDREKDLYSAHEVLQMIPVFERNNVYKKFLEKNEWVQVYLANAWNHKIDDVRFKIHEAKNPLWLFNISSYVLLILCYLLELPTKWIQQWYMKSHQTTEVISDTVLRFHPVDTREFIKKKYLYLLKKYKVPLDSPIFKSLQ